MQEVKIYWISKVALAYQEVDDRKGDTMDTAGKTVEAVLLIGQREFTQAAQVLKEVLEEDPKNNNANYYMGVLCLYELNYELAEIFFQRARDLGIDHCGLWMNLAGVQENLGEMQEAEASYKKAVQKAREKVERWACLTAQAIFYLKKGQYLRVKKNAAQLLQEFPEDYEGYHLQYEIGKAQKQYEICGAVLKKTREKFDGKAVYLGDVLELWRLTKEPEDVLALLKEDGRFMEVLPALTLRTRVELLGKLKRYEESRQSIGILAGSYQDLDAMIAAVLLAISEENYKAAKNICIAVMDKLAENTEDVRYFYAVYYSLFSAYFEVQGQVLEETARWMKQGVEYCEKWMQLYQMEDDDMEETLEFIRNVVQRA